MNLLSFFSVKLPFYLTYMAQQVEYEPGKLLAWLKRLPNMIKVMRRQQLVITKKALALICFQYLLTLFYVLLIGVLASKVSNNYLLLVLLTPLISIVGLVLAIYGGEVVNLPFNWSKIRRSRKIFREHPGLKIVILGSYGKTSMKELLLTVLGESKKVRATPGNKNVPISHARWAQGLSGDEDILLIELGEGKPGDIARFCRNISPDMAIITGIAPNHLDKYGTLDKVAEDLSSVADFVDMGKIYVNSDSKKLFEKNNLNPKKVKLFNADGTDKLTISGVKVSLKGMQFTAKNEKKSINLQTGLIGRHLIGPLAVCISLALELGVSEDDIIKAVKKTHPFEHRLQPRNLNGAWIIDDSYNGSLEGFRAGLALLKELKAKRKIYVTPGLVDQGEETENVHREIGKLIAQCNPDKVVLIDNSASVYISQALKESGYKGKIDLENDALGFYSNIDHILAAGDVIMLQNDWTDNYS